MEDKERKELNQIIEFLRKQNNLTPIQVSELKEKVLEVVFVEDDEEVYVIVHNDGKVSTLNDGRAVVYGDYLECINDFDFEYDSKIVTYDDWRKDANVDDITSMVKNLADNLCSCAVYNKESKEYKDIDDLDEYSYSLLQDELADSGYMISYNNLEDCYCIH